MTKMEQVKSHFSGSAEAPELEHYRPISPLVIGACFAGLASLLALVHPLLWIAPVVAIVLSLCAIIRVSSAQSRYSGRGPAVAALCFAALVGSYAPARTISRDLTLYAEARAKVEEWISLVQHGRVQEAHQLTQKADFRFQGPASLASFYAEIPQTKTPPAHAEELGAPPGGGEPSPAAQLTEFVTLPVVAKLLEFGEQSRIEHLRNVEMYFEYDDLKITLRYRASGVRDGRPESIEFLIRAIRHEEEQFASWNVTDLELMQ